MTNDNIIQLAIPKIKDIINDEKRYNKQQCLDTQWEDICENVYDECDAMLNILSNKHNLDSEYVLDLIYDNVDFKKLF